MRLLLLTDYMNGYSKSIRLSLLKKIDVVDIYYNSRKIKKENMSFKEKIVKSLVEDFGFNSLNEKYKKIQRTHFSDEVKNLKGEYDIILDIRGQSNLIFLEELKKRYSKSKFILFIWDDLKYQSYTLSQFKYFDKIYSFNEKDCEKYNLIYRPSFYCEEFEEFKERKVLESFYIGNIRDKKRVDTLLELNSILGENKKNNFYVDKKWKNFYRVHRWKEVKKISLYNHLSFEEIVNYTLKSKVLIDITYKNQVGLGLRPMESIGAGCKLITTNENIKKYDFYNSNNIFVLCENLCNLHLLKEFLNKPFEEYNNEIKKKYSINGWIEKVIFEEA